MRAGRRRPIPRAWRGWTGKNVINQGSCGEKSSGGADRVNTILDRYNPGYLCILYGANDAIFNLSVDTVINNLRYMIQDAKNNKTVPIVATLTPVYDGHAFASGNVQLYSDAIRQLAKDEGIKLADLNRNSVRTAPCSSPTACIRAMPATSSSPWSSTTRSSQSGAMVD